MPEPSLVLARNLRGIHAGLRRLTRTGTASLLAISASALAAHPPNASSTLGTAQKTGTSQSTGALPAPSPGASGSAVVASPDATEASASPTTSAGNTSAGNTARTAKPDAEEAPAPPSPGPLQLTVVERGPDVPWSLRINNSSDEAFTLNGDPRLLWFEVAVPGQTRPTLCQLPPEMRPKEDSGGNVSLEPGATYERHFDPRFYCFDGGSQKTLVPGAVVHAFFGWPHKTKTSWKRGKRVEVTLPAEAPFVASLQPPEEENPPKAQTQPLFDISTPEQAASNEAAAEKPSVEAASAHRPDAKDLEGEPAKQAPESPSAPQAAPSSTDIKNLDGNSFALNSEYRLWSGDAQDANLDPAIPLDITVTRGSDAANERSASIEISLRNHSKKSVYLYFRRELTTVSVLTPDGVLECPPADETRAPSQLLFQRLAPGQRSAYPARLIELCPRGTFARPGLYLVNADLNAEYGADAGESENLVAFVGSLKSTRPVPVRIRTGEQPFLARKPRAAGRPGAPAAPAAPVPAPVPPPPVAPTQ